MWYCPGCQTHHGVPVVGGRVWRWNDSYDLPTLNPSVIVHGAEPHIRCHCFVREGRIQFLADCRHALAGQTVVMEELT